MEALKRIISVALAFIAALFSYPLSFLPGRADTNFTVAAAPTAVESADGELLYKLDTGAEWFNYYGVVYSSEAYMKGILTYETLGGEKSEELFLEPGENAVFYSFVDGCLEGKKGHGEVSLRLKAAQGDVEGFTLKGFDTFNREVPSKDITLENAKYKIGVSLLWGGALSYLEDLDSSVEAVKKDGKIYVDSNASSRYGVKAVNEHVNLINRHDPGRLVQQSYYGVRDSELYENGYFSSDEKWRYNPVQGGNKYGDASKLVDLRVDDSSIYVKCRPMDWAKDAASISPSYMEVTYAFVGNTLKISCRFTDYSGYEATKTNQELPAFYCVEPLNRFVYYGGDKPWTGGELTAEPDLPFWGGPGKLRFKATENWAAFTGEFEDSFGIGVYQAERNTFIPGVYNRGETVEKDPSIDDPTSYFAIIGALNFESYTPFEYEYYVTTGDTAEIRSNFGAIAAVKGE